jgi:hypothetical protein
VAQICTLSVEVLFCTTFLIFFDWFVNNSNSTLLQIWTSTSTWTEQ